MDALRMRWSPAAGWLAVGAAIVMTFAGLCGCETMGGPDEAPPASPQQHPMLEGIPLPAGFRSVPERSVGRATGALRVGQYEFEGGLSPIQARRFFVENMPAARFMKKEERNENGAYSLRFESDTEVCNVCAKPAKGWSGKTTIVVDIGPLPRGSTEHDAKPAVRPQ